MRANARVRSGPWQQRWADPALTVLAIELAVAIFIIAPLGVLAPRSGLVLPLLLTVLVVTPVLLAAALVASSNGAAMAAVFVAIALIVTGMVFGFHRPSVLVTYLHMIGALIMGCADLTARRTRTTPWGNHVKAMPPTPAAASRRRP